MKSIDGRVTIFDQLDSVAGRGMCFPYALTADKLFPNPKVAVSILLQKQPYEVPANGSATYTIETDFGIDSFDDEGNILFRITYPKHCMILYPVSCNKLSAIYNTSKKGYENHNILNQWQLEEINYEGVDYYLYYQKFRTLEEAVDYKFVFKTNKELN